MITKYQEVKCMTDKELLYIDHRGITALNDIEGRQLSNIVAERIAKEVQKLDNLLSDAQYVKPFLRKSKIQFRSK